ncbi:acyltransferase family protein [Epilithonimonas mollis]|uniref:Peptidoglycan/LPS O-acetylase OafA/YrhL, contains acyltransferase and SGNH-hydrolase domains n=1 Tax=Epilithonimonas mollis TaxID=216903 RepID=A0A1M6RQD7_9FLAO|nr:acyltransferase [Epilithonimonas mollis]SHK34686.1 Peptidoglycan/LPS O-acetylase OafA/YrhL, contains acyltransferase and SGNH-hydrolase domains [Epilithonimonas mollis]
MITHKNLYLPGLNGIRAIAAIGVMIMHINENLIKFKIDFFTFFGKSENGQTYGWKLGEQGVTMFFVLSGFLITYLLLLEKKENDYINKKNFYIRRILRIWPLYYFYLFISILVYYFFNTKSPNLNILALYTFLLANIPFLIGKAIPLCTHLWSIAVEEQFYLFWPHFFKKINIENFLIIIIISFISIRILMWYFYPFKIPTILITMNRFDCMIFGGLVAFYHFKNNKIVTFLNHKGIQAFAWLIFLIHILNYEIVNSIVSMELITLATGIIIIGQINITNRIINLENKVLNFLGKYSYGIYVYHPLIIFLFYQTILFDNIQDERVKSICIVITIVITTILVSYFSYEFFEKKFIKLKNKFSVIHSTNSPS